MEIGPQHQSAYCHMKDDIGKPLPRMVILSTVGGSVMEFVMPAVTVFVKEIGVVPPMGPVDYEILYEILHDKVEHESPAC